MDLKQIENCFNAILGNNNEERNNAFQFLKKYANDINFSYLLARIIIEDKYQMIYKVLCLSIFINLQVRFPADLFPAFLPLLNNGDTRFTNQLARLLSKNISNEEQVIILLNSTSNSNSSYLYAVLLLLTEFLRNQKLFCDKIFAFCTSIISKTQSYPPESTNYNLILEIRGLAAVSINLITYPDEDEEQTNPIFSQYLISLFSLPVNDGRNINVVYNVFQSSRANIPQTIFFDICYRQFQTLAQMAPLTGQLINLASKFCYLIHDFIYDDYDIKYDPKVLIQSAICCSILNDETIKRWKERPNEFFIENIASDDLYFGKSNEEDGGEYHDRHNFFDLREECINLAYEFSSQVYEICQQIMRISPYHMEVAFLFLSKILPAGNNYFDLPCTPDEEPLLYGRYILTVASLNMEIDGGIIDECIETDNDILLFFTANAIYESENPVFIKRIVPVTMKLLSKIYMYNTPECSEYLYFIELLIEKGKNAFIPIITELNTILMTILHNVLPIYDATTEIILIYSVFNKIPQLTIIIQNLVLPFIQQLLLNSNGNTNFIMTGFDFLAALFCPLNNSILPIENIQPFFSFFMQIITNSMIAMTNPNDKSSSLCAISIDQISLCTIIPLLAFFARAIPHSPFASPVCKWTSQTLMCINQIKSKDFVDLPSLVVHIFQNETNHDNHISLMKALYFRYMSNTDSISYTFSLALSFSSIVLMNIDYFKNCTAECGIDIRTLLPQIPLILDKNSHEKKYIDLLIILAALFKFGDVTVIDHEEEKPMILVALRSLFSVSNVIFDPEEIEVEQKGIDAISLEYINEKKTSFNRDDPYFLNHPFRSMKFSDFLKIILPPIDQIPQSFHSNIQEIFNMF